jgi:hypothetical protein
MADDARANDVQVDIDQTAMEVFVGLDSGGMVTADRAQTSVETLFDGSGE